MARTSEGQVAAALTTLAQRDAAMAEDAGAALESVTFGEDLEAVSLYGLQHWLWYQLPVKWSGGLAEHQRRAAALGALFEELQMPRYAAVCTSPVTHRVLEAWQQNRKTGFTALAKAMDASGVQPPDVDGVLAWGHVLGMDENDAMNTAAIHLEMAIAAGDLAPGKRDWRAAAQQITAEFLTAPRGELGGQSWLERVQAERLERWATSRGPARAHLTEATVAQIAAEPQVPDDAQARLGPVRWLLDHAVADGGIPLTANHTLARAIVAEGCRRFNWLTGTGRPRSETDVTEAWTLREFLQQMGVVRRHKLRLVLTPAGKALAAADPATQWTAVTATLIPSDPAEALAAEITLMFQLTGFDGGYQQWCEAVAEAMAGEGWHDSATGTPITAGDVGWLIGVIHRRQYLFGLLHKPGLSTSDHLTEAGRAAAQAALRAHALRPRTEIGFG